jgi:hypothetical protein
VLARPLEAPPLVAHYSYDAGGRLRIHFFGE